MDDIIFFVFFGMQDFVQLHQCNEDDVNREKQYCSNLMISVSKTSIIMKFYYQNIPIFNDVIVFLR